jgi:asparagine synthase (glutamine-hydrolysing)
MWPVGWRRCRAAGGWRTHVCGVSGLVEFGGRRSSEDELEARARAMTGVLRHRGPDDAGIWVDEAAGVAMGHRRLAVIDLSPEGHQPMVSASGRWVISYNGEIYNFQELRAGLEREGHRFRGHSDTEVLLASIDRFGFPETLDRLNGMFAFALWDRTDRRLYLARDRLGEKPMYYGWAGSTLVYGSELKALRTHPDFAADIERASLAQYLRYSYVPAPRTIYQKCWKLQPGAWLALDVHGGVDQKLVPRRYWSLEHVLSATPRPELAPEEALDGLDVLLADAVKQRMVADVPVGAFLSGGIDSSLVVALMQAASRGSVRTFTIGFADAAYDESVYAAKVASHLGTDHTELIVTTAEAQQVVPRLPELYDEPFADSSQIPTFLVSELARGRVTVSLSGDGGDEMFAGYNRYVLSASILRRTQPMPASLRRAVSRVLRAVPPASWDRLFGRTEPVLPRRLRVRNPGLKIQKLANILPVEGPDELYRALVSQWPRPDELIVGGGSDGHAELPSPPAALTDPIERMMFFDTVGYLADDILVKVDRASMGVSLESRIPLLDHRVVEYAWGLPLSLKLRNGTGKWPLRQLLDRHVPTELVERPKMGFGLPIDQWLRSDLRDWAESLLRPERLRADGYFHEGPIRQAWARHVGGKADLQHPLWTILMFQAWLATSS